MPASAIGAVLTGTRPRFLDGIDAAGLKVIMGAATPRQVFANSIVTNQGNPANHVFLLTKGRARYFFITEEGEKILLLWLTPGDIFGGMALLSRPASYLVSTETVQDSEFLVWDRSTIRGLIRSYPILLENALLIADDYLAWYLADHAALITYRANQRLANILIYLAELIGEKVPGGYEFDATNEELASAAHITRFTASRLLSEWQTIGVVAKRRGKILLRSPQVLLQHVA